MKLYEIKITLLLKKDVKLIDVQAFLSSNVNKSMLEDKSLKKLHAVKGFKPYCLGSLYPFDLENKIYHKNQMYVLTMRSIDKAFLQSLSIVLKASKKLDFNVMAIEFLSRSYGFIESAFTLTPAIISIKDEEKNYIRYWTKEEGSLDFVKQRIKDNLEKKYEQFFNEKILAPDDFILMISIQNRKPMVYNYKGTKLWTNKFKIVFAPDGVSQKLASLAFGVGILEKNSLGLGFLTKGH
ncbi:MAG: CRISPR-associated endoribonuclease Cas6 [uncultured Sulfurovum sp.]|uniref:CRISPR-associated endoribonuclease Cas6 n=1 Tax=uncultured Sulfurovum sp. TaxID=269237 RepID=A0A6S6U722_9BACT|nr:MAG: CRISPR-associated endoribonuclease Cas6 [uncultured Sulfurovum sp.]